jgi:hypothetical protein
LRLHRHSQPRHGRNDRVDGLCREVGADAPKIIGVTFARGHFGGWSLGLQITGVAPLLAHGFGEGGLDENCNVDHAQSNDYGLAHFTLLVVPGMPLVAAHLWFEYF